MGGWKHTLLGIAVGAAITLGVSQWQQKESERYMNALSIIDILFERQIDRIYAFHMVEAGSLDKAEAVFHDYIKSDYNLKDHDMCMNFSRVITKLYDEKRNVFEMGRACALVNDTDQEKA